MHQVKPWAIHLIFGAVILLFGLSFHLNSLGEFPLGHHSWTQTDHYILSLRFQENGFDFFHPETNTITRDLVDGKEVPTGETITAVDFPIHQYLIGLLLALVKDSPVGVAKTYILIFSFIGLFFFAKIIWLCTSSWEKALIMLILAATSPLFVFFQTAVMPTIPAWAFCVTGIYIWIKYVLNPQKRYFVLAVLMLTLAALSRTTFIIPMLALFGTTVIFQWKNKSTNHYKFISLGLGFAVVAGYYIYNAHLRKKYGSIFLAELMPVRSYEELKAVLRLVIENWQFHYFSFWQYILILGVFAAGIWFFMRSRKLNHIQQNLLIFSTTTLLGCTMFFLAMAHQFPNHDYYFLDTFFTPVLLFAGLFFSFIPIHRSKFTPVVYMVIAGLLTFPLWTDAKTAKAALSQTDWWNRTAITHENFKNSDQLMRDLAIDQSAVILVLDAYSPNLPFYHLKRIGHPIINTSEKYLKEALQWQWDYVIIQNEFFFCDIYQQYPQLIHELERVGGNGKISVYRRLYEHTDQELYTFLGMHRKNKIMESDFYPETASPEWSLGANENGDKTFSNAAFPITFKTKSDFVQKDGDMHLLVNIYAQSPDEHPAELVVKINRQDTTAFYRSYTIYRPNAPVAGAWLTVPLTTAREEELVVYLWNPEGNQYRVDSARVMIYNDGLYSTRER